MAFLTAFLSGCGVVYEPQEFAPSSITYGYKGDFETAIEVIPMTFLSVRTANLDGYVPKSLPSIFLEPDPIVEISTRERIAQAGLDRVEPALIFDPVTPPAPYDSRREIVPPLLREQQRPPLPVLTPPQRSVDLSAPAASPGAPDLPAFSSDADLDIRLEKPQIRQRVRSNPLPNIEPVPYRVGPGDVIEVRIQALAVQERQKASQQLLVQDNGDIFMADIGPISVGGMTLDEVRRVINDQIVNNGFGFDPGVEITRFGSKKISVNGLNRAALVPVTIRPTTLGEAITDTGGFGSNPANTIVRVLRKGSIYEMAGDEILSPDGLLDRPLIAGDVVSVTSGYNPESALAYFDQQLKLREIERTRYEDALKATLREQTEARSAEGRNRDRIRFDIELENYRLEAERLRQESEIARIRSERETDQANEEARIANLEARQGYLDRLRQLTELNRSALRDAQRETRETLIANQAERRRELSERRALLELELAEERRRFERQDAERRQARELFVERERLGAIQRDYVTIAGEIDNQTTMALPLDGRLTLNRVLYEEGNGINRTSGDSSEIYVFRTPPENDIDRMLIAYHLNASNPAALAVASMFEMRPNDVVYVNPQPITKWNRVLTQILPSTGLLQTGVSAARGGL